MIEILKSIFKILKWLVSIIVSVTILVIILLALDRDARYIPLTTADRQAITPRTQYSDNGDSHLYDSLFDQFGTNKKLPLGFELQCLLALSHYPELKETHIEFVQEPSFLQLASRPDPLSVLLPWVERKYLVIISTEPEDDPILLKNTPFNEQVGILGHELAHSLYYQDKNSFQLLKLAYQYQYDDAVRKQFEREADKTAIAHGLGYQLYDFAFFVRIHLGGSTQEEIEADEGGTYLSPKEIAREMEIYGFYRHPLPPASSYFDDKLAIPDYSE